MTNSEPKPDTGDLIEVDAPDPTGPEVAEADDSSFVEAYSDATPVDEED